MKKYELEELKKIFTSHSEEYSLTNSQDFNLPLALVCIISEIISVKKILQENIDK